MALFSQELFEVFEEKSDPVSLTGKKRKRPEEQKEKGPEDGQKKVRTVGEAGSSSDGVAMEQGPSTSTAKQQPSDVVDLTGDDDDTGEDPKEMM